jgi:thioredoxin reductase
MFWDTANAGSSSAPFAFKAIVMKKEDAAIIGAGPAGITTAIQLKRYGVHFLLFERERIGGLLWNAGLVENYPGFPNGVTGPKLIALMEKQMERIGVKARQEEVTRVDWNGADFIVETQEAAYKAGIVVVATGTRARPIPEVVTAEARGRVFSEVHPLSGARRRRVAIIGAGDAAFDYALNLAKKRNYVTILNHGRDIKCLELLRERVAAEPAIEYRDGIAVRQIEADETATRLTVRYEAKGASGSIETDYVLFAIGRDPNLDFLSERVRQQEAMLVTEGHLYFCGDTKNGLFRQTAIAAGDGLRAAMQIYHILKGSE